MFFCPEYRGVHKIFLNSSNLSSKANFIPAPFPGKYLDGADG
jgi:hypothetical protein